MKYVLTQDEYKNIVPDNMGVFTSYEKTDFGEVWYMTSDPKGIFRFAIYRYDDDRDTIYLSNQPDEGGAVCLFWSAVVPVISAHIPLWS